MLRFVFFTKTRWDEPPRLRHQLARLLACAGHEIIFCTKPRYPWQKKSLPAASEPGLRLCQHQELMHHRLRIFSFLRYANSYWTRRSMREIVREFAIGANDIIVNFNYEYYFLRELFTPNKLITIINDDFVSCAPVYLHRPLEHALRLTCQSSDLVLTVSHPLLTRLSKYCTPQLFRPWAESPYCPPAESSTRDTLLFWGFVNPRIDFKFILDLAEHLHKNDPHLRFLLVGPVEKNVSRYADILRSRSNVELASATKLENLPLERVLAALIPYRRDVPSIGACMLPNKALPLLAKGLPLLITGMPHAIKGPFIFSLDEQPALQVIRQVQERFEDLQPSIRDFVSQNGPEARLEQFMNFVQLS